MTVMENIPPAIVHTLVSIAISHRIIQMAPEAPGQNKLVKPIWSRLYRHRDIALTAINKMVRSEKARGDLVTVISVYTFLFAMVRVEIQVECDYLVLKDPHSCSNPSHPAGEPMSRGSCP
jgi:hypothetical protein